MLLFHNVDFETFKNSNPEKKETKYFEIESNKA